MGSGERALLDRVVLKAARAERGRKFEDDLAYLVEDGAKAITRIERASQICDAHGVVRPAQGLKNEARAMGALRLAAMAASIEAAGYGAVRFQEPLTGVDEQVAMLRSLFDRSIDALRAEVGERSPIRRAVSVGIRAMVAR